MEGARWELVLIGMMTLSLVVCMAVGRTVVASMIVFCMAVTGGMNEGSRQLRRRMRRDWLDGGAD